MLLQHIQVFQQHGRDSEHRDVGEARPIMDEESADPFFPFYSELDGLMVCCANSSTRAFHLDLLPVCAHRGTAHQRVAGHGFGSCRRHSDLVPRQPKPPRGLAVLGRQELVFACDRISRVGATDLRVWDSYALRLQAEVPCCTLEELCVVLSALRRANFSKRPLLNAICRRAKREVQLLSSGQTARVVSDLRKLRHLDGPLLPHLTNGLGGRHGRALSFRLGAAPHSFCEDIGDGGTKGCRGIFWVVEDVCDIRRAMRRRSERGEE